MFSENQLLVVIISGFEAIFCDTEECCGFLAFLVDFFTAVKKPSQQNE